MKVVAKPIDVVAWFDKDGIHPAKFRIEGKEGKTIVKIGKIVKKDMEKLAGNLMLVFTCESEINGQVKPYEIKYELNTMKWMLFKI
ncbi:MAG: hypothetical protein Q8930_19040 [Bacillota bacterium]|nr:hypothetical protein [Bacillota bacterium]